jgi:hypothetical protein
MLCSVVSPSPPAATAGGEGGRLAGAAPGIEVHVRHGLLTVHLQQAPWARVLQVLERHTGVQFVVRGALPGTVTQAFEALPLEQGLRRLFHAANVFFVYAPGGPAGAVAATLRQVWLAPREERVGEAQPILPTPTGRSSPTPPEAAGAVAQTAQAPAGEEGSATEGEPLAEQDQETRLSGLHALAQQGQVAALQQAVFDPDQTIQATAVELLAEQDHRGAVALLVGATSSAEPERRLQALHLLTTQADERTVLGTLGEALADVDVAVKRYAMQALAERGGSEAWQLLRETLRDPDPAVRMAVLESVGPLASGPQLVQEALADEDADVRAIATFWREQTIFTPR